MHVATFVVLSLGLWACGQDRAISPHDSATDPQNGAAKLTQSAQRAGGMYTTKEGLHFFGPESGEGDAGGISVLRRSAGAVDVTIQARNLPAEEVISLWWVIFNHPEACDGPCDGPDLGNAAVMSAVLGAAGSISNANGEATIRAHLAEGPHEAQIPFGLPGDLMGLVDAQQAEIHLVLRTHGAPLEGQALEEQLSTFNGGCGAPDSPDTPGDACYDIQAAGHFPRIGHPSPDWADLFHATGPEVSAEGEAGGASLLWRSGGKVWTRIYALNLPPEEVISLWWVILNNPEACEGPCGEADLGNPDVEAAVLGAAGTVSDAEGRAVVRAVLEEGPSMAEAPFGLPGDSQGLIDAQQAEIWLVLRSHGPAQEGEILHEQLSTFNGGCGGPGTPDEPGDACIDRQFSVHSP